VTEDMRYIPCDKHGPQQRAYFVCRHLVRRRDPSLVVHYSPWVDDPSGAGELCCAIPFDEHIVDDLMLMCEGHLIELGLLAARANA
jgi:hypothetical protein